MGSRVERIRLDGAKLPALAAEIIASELIFAVSARGSASLCLSGGTTPRQTYELLARLSDPSSSPGSGRSTEPTPLPASDRNSVPWNQIRIFFGDERCVPPDHADSNYRMAREALFEPARIAETSIQRMRGENPDFDAAARAYEELLPERFDVVVLGIGEDGHTASLFPHSAALHETRRVVHVVGDKPPPNRLTLTPRAFDGAGLLLVLAAGRGKAGAVQRALEGPLDIESCPVQIAKEGVWLMDMEAASALSGGWSDSAASKKSS
jgi:6-phosphogluconolactonase